MKRILIPLVLILSACDPTPPPQPETERQANPAFETQIQAVEKARAVEGLVMGAAAMQRTQMDEAAR
jgi:hypothetical protein